MDPLTDNCGGLLLSFEGDRWSIKPMSYHEELDQFRH